MKNTLHLLWCTIRPSVFIQMHQHWISRSGNPSLIKTHVAVNTIDHFNQIDSYLKTIKNHQYRIISVNTDKIGVCYPSYQLSSTTEGKKGDIVIFASDDFYPPKFWDEYLYKTLKEKEGGLFVNDGYQNKDSSNMLHPCISLPILTWGCFEKLNKVIYHPSYFHMFSDCELYLNLKDLQLLINSGEKDMSIVFEHLHHSSRKRKADQFDASYYGKWREDEINWNKRRNLPVEERIKV